MEEKILKAIEGLNSRFDKVDERLDNMEGRFDKIDGRIDSLEGRFDSLEGRFDNMEGRFDNLEVRFDRIESQVSENTRILKALEHAAQVNKAEHDKMAVDMAQISGDVKAIRKDLSTVEIITANNYADIAKLKAVK